MTILNLQGIYYIMQTPKKSVPVSHEIKCLLLLLMLQSQLHALILQQIQSVFFYELDIVKINKAIREFESNRYQEKISKYPITETKH